MTDSKVMRTPTPVLGRLLFFGLVMSVATLSRISIALVVFLSIVLIPEGPVRAGDDYPLACRDASAVMHSARQYSKNTAYWKWDEKKMWQAFREYGQCLHAAADAEDEFEAVRGASWALSTIAYRDYNLALVANVLPKATLSERRRYFLVMSQRAIREYKGAQRLATNAIDIAHEKDVDMGDFEGWSKRMINTPLSEASALTFERLKSYRELTEQTPPASALPKPKPVAATCATPNVKATTVDAVAPDTPPEAQNQGVTGVVNVVIQLDENSNIVGTPTIQSSPSQLLNSAAITAAQKSRFRAAIRNCHPIPTTYIYAVEFNNN